MIINKLFEYAALERVTRPDGVRHYRCPQTGILVPSVTTIIGAMGGKKELIAWRARVGDAKADAVSKEATVLGTMVHERVESFVTGIAPPRGNFQLRKLAEMMSEKIIKHGMSNVDEIWGQEIGLYYPGMYAGTTDIVGVYKGKPAIMDHKTAKKMRKAEMIEDYFCQLGAYACAKNHVYGTNIKTGVIFMVTREGEFKEFLLEEDKMDHYQTQFLLKLEKYLDMFPSA